MKNPQTYPLTDTCDGPEKSDDLLVTVSGESTSGGIQIQIQIPGYETNTGIEDDAIVILEVWEGRLRLLIWDDINAEEPTIVPLDKAKKTNRSPDDALGSRT